MGRDLEMERSPGLEAPDTISLLEEPTSLPGVDLRCGSRPSYNHNLSNSDPPGLMQDTLVCKEATEALTNGVNPNRAATQGTSNKDTTPTTQHTIRANTRSNTLLLPLTKAPDRIPMLTSSQFSVLTFLSNCNHQDQPNAHFFPDRPPLPLPCSCDQPTTFSLAFSGVLTISYMVFLFGDLSDRSQYYQRYNLPLFAFWLTPRLCTNVFSLSTLATNFFSFSTESSNL